MFGKEHQVVTEKDVGDFIEELHKSTVQPLDEVLDNDADMVRESETTTSRSQS